MQEEREEKPKKLFVVTHIVYDDGEIDTELSEYRKNASGRGAPSKWRLTAKELKTRIEETLGDAEQIAEIFSEHLALSTPEESIAVKPIKPPRGFKPDPKEVEELDKGREEVVDETKAASNDVKKEDEDIDFGNFDTDEAE